MANKLQTSDRVDPSGVVVAIERTLPKPFRKRVTLADVAAKAGVSVATASVAITGRPSGNCRVSVEVAERIRAAARELNYRPNIQARSLSTQRTNTVAMLIKRAAWHNAMYYVSAMQRMLRARGYAETFMLHPDNRLETEREQLETCIERRVEGIIIIPVIDLQGHCNVELLNQIHRDEGIPIVQLGLALPGCIAPAVTMDEIQGVSGGVRLLHAMGHRRIAHATMPGYDDPEYLNPYRQAHLRYLGYRKAVTDLGMREQVFAIEGDYSEIALLYDRAREMAAQVAAAVPRPTAVITFTDYTAAGLVSGLFDLGLRVPDDISVLAVGEQPFDRMLRPALSTLAPQFDKIGEVATQTLLQMIDGKPGESTAVAPSLIMRDSVRELKDAG